MGELISIETGKARQSASVNARWAAYVEARDKAEKSRDVQDGIACGKAWRAFLSLFDAAK